MSEKLTQAFLKKPLNADAIIGQPMLFARMPVAKLKVGGDARLRYSIMTGDWFVTGQKANNVPYLETTLSSAVGMMKTVNHFNETGEIRKFKGNISELELCDE